MKSRVLSSNAIEGVVSTPTPSHHVYEDLGEDLTWFLACPEMSVLHIATSLAERPGVMQQVALAEGHGQSPFFVLEEAYTKDDDGWVARAEQMTVIHQARREAMAKVGISLGKILPVVPGKNNLAVFGWQLKQCIKAQRDIAEFNGLVVVFAPTVLEKAKNWVRDIVLMTQTPSLEAVRIIVIELGNTLVKPLQQAFGEAVMGTECVVDPARLRQEQKGLLAAMASAPEGASPEVSIGCAGPKDVVACFGKPLRDSALSAEQSELLTKEFGPAAALVGAKGARLQRQIAGAALAAQEGRFHEAVTLQNEAIEACTAAGLVQHALILELALANYLLGAGEKEQAGKTFESVASRAEAAGALEVAAQALVGLGAVLATQKDFEASVRRYAQAGRLAAVAQSPIFAMEAYRAAGQLALRNHAEKAAIIAWKQALEIAKASPGPALGHSSAPEVARALAKVMQKRRSFAAAKSLLAQADEYEARKTAESEESTDTAPESESIEVDTTSQSAPVTSGENA